MEHTDKRKCCSGMAEHAEAAKPDVAEKKAEHKEGKQCCCHKKKERSEKEYKDLIHRLNRIEGQIRIFFLYSIYPMGVYEKAREKNHAGNRTPGRMLFYFIGNCVL